MFQSTEEGDKDANPLLSIRRYDANGVHFWTARDLMGLLDIDSFAFFKDERNSLISNAIAEYVDCGIEEGLGFRKKHEDWDLSYIACHFIFKRFDDLRYPKVRKAQEYFACFGEVFLNPSDCLDPVIIYFEPPEVMPKHKQPGVVFTSNRAIIQSDSVDSVEKTEQTEIIPSPKPVEENKSNPLPSEGISPFDAIRRYDKEGNEYWSARELMEFMGYDTWRRFENPIEEAIENLELTGEIALNHIAASDKVVHRPQGGGSTLSDYKLSRHGCYMIAICCDRRKPEVAMAKRYFTRATRENELRKQREANEGKLKISDEEALKMAMECLEVSGVEQPVISQFKMRQLAKLDPAHKEIYESVCGQLASSYVLENKPILVTKVGQMICDRLGLNRNMVSFAKTVNQKLIEIGMQEKDIKYKDNKPYNKGYVLTKKGEPWAIVENPTDSEGRVRPQIKYNQQLYLSIGILPTPTYFKPRRIENGIFKYNQQIYLRCRLKLLHPCCVRLGQEWVG